MPQKPGKLSRDTFEQEQSPDTYPFAKNGIQDWKKGSILNEPGFLPSSAVIPFQPIGIINSDKHPIILSTDNINSAIGYFDADADTYIPILDDRSLSFKLGFDSNFYITGQAQRNHKGEVVCAFTDKTKQLGPMYLNCDNPQINSLADLKLFPVSNPPDLDVTQTGGGSLYPGAYFVAVRYIKNDGTTTQFVATSSPSIVQGTVGTASDKALQITVSGIDADYDQVQIAIISKIAGVTSGAQLDPIPARDSLIALYTGNEITQPITLEEVLIPPAVYDSVGTIAQLNDALYLMKLTSPDVVRMQKFASLIRIKWHSTLESVTPVDQDMASGQKRGFMHGEVYTFYARFRMNTGTISPAFHIPGPALGGTDDNTVTYDGTFPAKRYQIEDTISSFDFVSKTGYMGKWQNDTEAYPNTDDFNATAIGGTDLRNQPVRHHRFPSVRWCKQNLYQGEVEYGRKRLDLLGISVENLIVPAEYADIITGVEILYARRTIGNSTVLGQSLLLFGARAEEDTGIANYYSTGGNWNSKIDFRTSDDHPLDLEQSIFHFHAFDILFNRPTLTPTYLAIQLREQRTNIPPTGGYIEDSAVNGENDGPMVYLLDYIDKGDTPSVPAAYIKAVKETEYVPANLTIGKWKNDMVEGFYGGRLSVPETLIDAGDISNQEVQPGSRHSFTPPENAVQLEVTFLTNLMALRDNLYTPFTGQTLVRAGQTLKPGDATTVLYGGDTFVSDYTFHTYGWWTSRNSNPDDVDGGDLSFKGTKVARRFTCETAANLYSRYEIAGNAYSRFYPKSPLVPGDATNYLTNFLRTIDPNQFGYTKDLNSLDDLISSQIYNSLAEYLTDHPYRIHRSGKLDRENKQRLRSWRTFLPLDYYEIRKDLGFPVHGEGMDDRLIIHCENSMLLTQDKTHLESDILSVTLGTADIFQFEPQEGLSSPLGYAGTQHDLACVRTPFGYIFIDSRMGQIFIYKGQLDLINNLMNTFFDEFLRLKEKNVFIGNGYTIGYDPKYKRILLTVKNRQLTSGEIVPEFTEALLATLQPGDKVFKDGRVQEYLGIDQATFDCAADIIPVVPDQEFSVSEDAAVGSTVGTLTGTGADNYYLLTPSVPFSMEAPTGRLRVAGVLDYATQNNYALSGRAVNRESALTSDFAVTVDVLDANSTPVAQSAEVRIPEDILNDVLVHTVVAHDPDPGDTLSYTIVAGNDAGVFAINSSTGAITVVDNSTINYEGVSAYSLIVRVSDGSKFTDCVITITLTDVNDAPAHEDQAFSIPVLLDIADGYTVGTVDMAIDEDRPAQTLTYQLIAESNPGAFGLNTTTRVVTALDVSLLTDPSTETLTIRVTDNGSPALSVTFTVTIQIGVAP